MKYIRKSFIRWASLCSLLVSTAAAGQTVHISHCMAGCPVVTDGLPIDDSELVVRQLFAASINGESGLADWQAYRVLAGSVGVASLLPRVWYEDPLVSAAATVAEAIDDAPQFVQSVSSDAEERNYQLSEITLLSRDQGRLVPMSSFAGTPYWSELNYLSNLSPLPFELRVGSWARLDQAINALADQVREVFVLSGPVYADGVAEPVAYFKVVSNDERLSAFLFDSNLRQHVSFCDQLSTLEAVEAATGLTLFPQRQGAFAATLHTQLSCTF